MTFGESIYGETPYGEPPAAVGDITVVGEVAVCVATGLSGSALTEIVLAGEVAVSAATALTGAASLGPITINGEVASVSVTALDGSALTQVLVVGDVASLSAQANDGAVLLGPVPGSVAVINLTALDGGIAFDTTTDTSNVFGGRSRGGFATVELAVPVVEPIGVATSRVDKAVPLPLPVLVKGRPT